MKQLNCLHCYGNAFKHFLNISLAWCFIFTDYLFDPNMSVFECWGKNDAVLFLSGKEFQTGHNFFSVTQFFIAK